MSNQQTTPAPILTAVDFAARKHRDQRRKDEGASPYINHPIAVAYVLTQAGVDDFDVLCAALLHDTIEDTQATRQELQDTFGTHIASIVMECSDDKSLPKTERKRLQIEHALHLSPAAQLVKLGDKICNLRDVANNAPPDWSLERRREYFDWVAEVVRELSVENDALRRMYKDAAARKP